MAHSIKFHLFIRGLLGACGYTLLLRMLFRRVSSYKVFADESVDLVHGMSHV